MNIKILGAAVFFCWQAALAAAANIPLMPVQDLEPGMRGIGKTVVSGDTIENFDVEVIGVSGREVSDCSILVRLDGDLIERAGGVAQGMSGSPVFIDGRLVGAVAYGRIFNDPHYCFLTPIGSMLKMLDTPQKQQLDWIPKSTALTAGGFTELGVEVLKEQLGAQGLDVVMGVAQGTESDKPLEPGSSVGATLVTGDFTLGALGTVTWTDDEGHVLAFGHPFQSRGESNFFMNRVWVLGVIPNMSASYKIGNIGSVIGKFDQDRASGIAGNINEQPKSIPLVINVTDSDREVNNSARMRVIDDPELIPAIVNAATVSSVNKTADRSLTGTAKVHFQVTGVDKDKNYLVLNRENMYYATEKLEKGMVQELTESLTTLLRNKFEKLEFYGMNVDVDITEAVKVAEITKISVQDRKVKAGAKVPVTVTMRPYRGKEFTHVIEYTIPEKAEPGKLIVNVHGGSSMAWIFNLMRKQKEDNPDRGTPRQEQKQKTIKDFINDVNRADKNNDLIIDITGGMKSAGKANGDESLSALLKGSPYKKRIPFDFIIDGEAEMVLNVEK